MHIIFFFIISVTTVLSASSMQLLGDSNNHTDKTIKSKNSILWTISDGEWTANKPQDILEIQDNQTGYVLINNDEMDYSTKEYKKTFYHLKKGWNYLSGAKDGVDIVESFKNEKKVEFVYVYDKPSQAWAGYSPSKELMNKIVSTRIIYLKYVEPRIGFYVYALEPLEIEIKSTQIDELCQAKIDADYEVLVSSGTDKDVVYNIEKSIGIKSRYLSHYKRGVYNDSRVALIYPKISKKETKKLQKYGPVSPKTKIYYAKEYENKHFYIYDYLNRGCYEGIFPSIKIPPFSSLKKLK